MRHLWLRLRLPLAILSLLLLTLVMARLFSGPEDAWIKNDSGEWVKHGHPYGPPPPPDYQEPQSHLIIPFMFLVGFVVPLFFLGFHKPHNHLTYETVKRDLKIMGYLSIALPLTGILIMTGLLSEISFTEQNSSIPIQDTFFNILFIFSLAGFAGFSILLGPLFYILKRNCNDHYQLEKSRREIIEILETIQAKK